jgi:hypothetical protein
MSTTNYLFLRRISVLSFILSCVMASSICAETYGIKDQQGNFIPKINVTLGNKEVLIKKVDSQEKIKSLGITLNAKNKNLIRNIGLINIEWMDAANKPSKAVLFAGPLYNANTRHFQDSLTKSSAIRLIDKSNKNLFAAKHAYELFTLSIDDQNLVFAETATEQDKTVRMGSGKDVSINVDKSVINFGENNIKTGELINVENRSGLDQVFGVDPIDKGVLYFQIVRTPEQTRIPKESWERFSVVADSGFFIVIIPEPDANQLTQLDGKEIIIKIYQGNKIRETRKIPIKVSEDLKAAARKNQLTDSGEVTDSGRKVSSGNTKTETSQGAQSKSSQTSGTTRTESGKETAKYSMWLWILQIMNFLLLAGLAIYTFLFIMPKMQILEDRLAKNEMFIHNSREAIREELDHLKHELRSGEVKHNVE